MSVRAARLPQPSQATVAGLLRDAAARLDGVGDSPALDAEVLLRFTMGWSAADAAREQLAVLAARRVEAFDALVARRLRGEPIAYIVGVREFHSMEFEVTPVVLIPRPETETLVERALEVVAADRARSVLDLGTGSGNVAVAIAAARPACRVLGVDLEHAALDLARRNARRHRCANVEFLHGDWFSALDGRRFDVAVANPPYVAETDPCLKRGDVRFEPRRALCAGPLGLDAIAHLAAHARDCLNDGGRLLVEHGAGQGACARGLFRANGFVEVATLRDLARRERVTEGRAAP